MRKTIEKIRQKDPQEKKRITVVISAVITVIVALIVFTHFWWEVRRADMETIKTVSPIDMKRSDLVSEIKTSLEQLRQGNTASVPHAKDALQQ